MPPGLTILAASYRMSMPHEDEAVADRISQHGSLLHDPLTANIMIGLGRMSGVRTETRRPLREAYVHTPNRGACQHVSRRNIYDEPV